MWGEWMGDDKIVLNQDTGCEYCKEAKHIQENENDNIFLLMYGKHLRITGKIFSINFGRDVLINYCPMCR